jgi:hypothetical protein
MDMPEEIVNRVTTSNLITFDLEQYYVSGERVVYDIKNDLFQELILREKDFREHVKSHNWSQFQNKLVAVTCSVDAVVPTWAYMLLVMALKPYAKRVFFGSFDQLESHLFQEALSNVDWSKFKDEKVVIKGCSHLPVPVSAYMSAMSNLLPLASSVMFGEPCSTVPLYKRPKS